MRISDWSSDVCSSDLEFAVTGYCGLQDAAVEAGYHAEVAALTARHGFDAEAARRQRLRGWVAAEDEWRNRGLGGNRAWCAGEGPPHARHFQAIARGVLQPSGHVPRDQKRVVSGNSVLSRVHPGCRIILKKSQTLLLQSLT